MEVQVQVQAVVESRYSVRADRAKLTHTAVCSSTRCRPNGM